MELYKLVDISEWKTIDTIATELHTKGYSELFSDRRKIRKHVEEHNERFNNHETDIYIAHGPKGYKATRNTDEIKASIGDLYGRSVNMLKKYYGTMKALNENTNVKFDLEKEGLL